MKKNYKRSLLKGILVFSALSIMVGCGNSADSGSGSTPTTGNPEVEQQKKEEAKVGFNLNFTALRSQVLGPQSNRVAQAEQLLRGELTVKNQNTGASKKFDWTTALNDENWQADSLRTIILEPTPYEFSILLNKGNQQYVGEAIAAINDGTNNVAMTIRPVIGDTITDVGVIGELADFKIQYPAAELAQLTAPKIGISIDGAAEVIYELNKETGLQTDSNYINLSEQQHTIKLNLYDGETHVGKSKADHETPTIQAGEPVNIDLVALHGETTFSLTTDGGEGTFHFNIPAAVAEEAGGVENLKVKFSMSGNKNPLQETLLTLGSESEGLHPASTTLSGLYYDEVTLSLEFMDKQQNDEKLGSCTSTSTVTLSTDESSVDCKMTLRRRAIIGGNLLATVGVTVVDEAGKPVQGAAIRVNNNKVGLTGSGNFGTAGYLKFFLKSGQYRVKASQGNLYGSVDASMDVLGIENLLITLKPVPASATSCKSIKEDDANAQNGLYWIDPDGPEGANEAFEVYCDMQTDGGGWTVIQRRQDGSVDFLLDWNSYKNGFGQLVGEHWLGNDNIHLLTNLVTSELRIDMKWINPATAQEEAKYAQYSTFKIADESDKYRLTVGGFSEHEGNPGDSLIGHNGMQFSTKDQDNDLDSVNCAGYFTGAWWYHACHSSNLNGRYGIKEYADGVIWYTWTNHEDSLSFVEMKVR